MAILLVVFGHAVDALTSNPALTPPDSIIAVDGIIYGFHMPVFFIVAGFFVENWTKKKLFTGVKSKFYRLGIPYFTWGLLFAVYKHIGGSQSNHPDQGLMSFVYSPFIPWNFFWFLYALFFIHVLYDILVHGTGDYRRGRKAFFLLAVVLFLVRPYLPALWILPLLAKFMIFFAFGTYVLVWIRKATEKMTWLHFFGIVALFVAVNAGYVQILFKHDGWLQSYAFFFTGVSGSLFLLGISWAILRGVFGKGVENWVRFCGVKSMEFYVLHPFIIGALRVIAKKCVGYDYLWPQTLVIGIVPIIICTLIWKYVSPELLLYRILFGTILTSRK